MHDSDILPYVPCVDIAPYGCDLSTASQVIIGEQLRKISRWINRDIPVLTPHVLQQDVGSADVVNVEDFGIKPGINAVVFSRRPVYARGRLGPAGVSVFSEDGIGNGSLTWVTLPPNGITRDSELGAIESKTQHELLHTIGLGHCAVGGGCIMAPYLSGEELYEMSKHEKSLCRGHVEALGAIARNPLYFATMRQKTAVSIPDLT